MSSASGNMSVAEKVMAKIGNATIYNEPYPFIYIPDIFPLQFFGQIRENLPVADSYRTLHDFGRVGSGYSKKRVVVPMDTLGVSQPEKYFDSMEKANFWKEMMQWFISPEMMDCVMTRFFGHLVSGPYARSFEGKQMHHEALLIRDSEAYQLGPHTDSPAKVISFLYYLPETSANANLGTSIYTPKQPGFKDPGGPHLKFEDFNKLVTMPFLPNTLFGFLKTDVSFHGVEPVAAGFQRDILLYDIKAR